jgi:hypothetical protein
MFPVLAPVSTAVTASIPRGILLVPAGGAAV